MDQKLVYAESIQWRGAVLALAERGLCSVVE